ncbi:MAG: DNA polymerase I [bacterium]|nr:DNA polymerase I [bacterium]MDD5756139.1 DNA polymerase I [bacterium]
MKKKLYIIDGHAYIHRAFHALPMLTNSQGLVINAVYGFTRMLLKIIKREQPDYLAVCFDSPQPTFRHKAFEQYKATRKETPEELKTQIPMVQEMVEAFKIPVFRMPGYEADDLIATIARQAEKQDVDVIVISGDKDILQLVGEHIKVLSEPKGILFSEKEVEEKFGFSADKIKDYLGLCGDSSDNIPGVPGIGEKTALQLVKEYGTIENMYKNLDKMPVKVKNKMEQGRELAFKSKELVTLVENVPLTMTLDDLKPVPLDQEKALALFNRYEFKSLSTELIEQSSEKDACYEVITSPGEMEKIASQIKQKKEVSIDLETNSREPMLAEAVGLVLCFEEKKAYYIPLAHSYLGAPQQDKKKVLDLLGSIIEDEKIKKYGQNLKYDLLVLKNEGFELKGISFDVMISSYLINPSKLNHSLEDIAAEYLQYKMIPISDLIGKGAKQITMDQVTVERAGEYACAQVDMVWRLKQKLSGLLKEKGLDKLFYDIEMPVMEILAEMEYTGILVDLPYLKELSKEIDGKITALEQVIYKIAGAEFNINSPQQLSRILFEKLGLPIIEKTKTGASTNESVLRQLQAMHELPKRIIEYRELAKLKSTYIDPIPEMINPKTGRLHTSFNQTVTNTGRLSSSEPNLQNIPIRTEIGRSIRRSFIPKKECVFISADYSQIDLRVLAHMSGDEHMKQAFHNHEDIHSHTACEIFGLKPEEIDDEKRRIAKTVNFGLSYGMSPYGLSQALGIDAATAKDYIDKYFARFSGVKEYMEKIVEKARHDGFVTTLLNRRRYLPEINAKDRNIRSFAERVAINMPIQGTAADIIKIAMINIAKKLKQENFQSKMLLQVHDELIFEVPKAEVKQLEQMIKQEMETALKLDVPLEANVSIGPNWRDLD